MKILTTEIVGVHRVEGERVEDERGYFVRVFDRDAFRDAGLEGDFPQHSLSLSKQVGTVRGLHFQRAPHREAKVVRCLRGAIYDVAVDVRPDSPTFGRWWAIELHEDDDTAVYLGPGIAHGFQSLTADTQVQYLISSPYVADAATGIRFDDPQLSIPWPLPPVAVSCRDRGLPLLADAHLPRGHIDPPVEGSSDVYR